MGRNGHMSIAVVESCLGDTFSIPTPRLQTSVPYPHAITLCVFAELVSNLLA